MFSPDPQARIPRPPNPFIIFRTHFARKYHNPQRNRPRRPSTLGRTVSGKAADAWRELPAPEKEKYRQLAEAAKRQHAIDYPDYQYRPQRRTNQAAPAASSSSRRVAPAPAPRTKKRSRSPAVSIHTTHITAMDALKITDSPPLKKRSCSPELEWPQPMASGSSITADRRRSSSVPVTSGEHFYTLGIWPSVEEQPGDGWEPPVQSRRRSRSGSSESPGSFPFSCPNASH
ncbi:hypothetical protein FB45DRAFT_921608 [Roridomyces roridus]|uniref:HMG box domain-containing protein n=1 Tax=Roridomyces roridus TaxID=1738132 RepID=A0AAD7BN23_9AGAR|nr:hypothetical protein FB45DRAFT_921608 [Roridomyces roridus]